MDKVYNHQNHEKKIYDLWEKSGAFNEKENAKPYTILMPPPNANASLHAGHAMYTIDDVVARFKRMQGFNTQWIPGMDHAGFETQYVYEKNLNKEGKSRFDYDRNTLYQNIFDFVKENSGLIYEQFKRLGFSANWNRSVFTLDPRVVDTVFNTFSKMESENLVYRDDYIVNYCTHCGTSLAELEVLHEDRTDFLFYIKYPIKNSDKFVVVATVRPETMFGDTAVAVNPKDKRYKDLIGQTLLLPLTTREIPVIAEEGVDMEFGTGALKITPAHDPFDFNVGQKNKFKNISVINLFGKTTLPDDVLPTELNNLKAKEAREKTVELLKQKKLIEKIDENYNHAVTICYKCKRDLEPSIIPNWFIKVANLKAKVREVVENDEVKFTPKRFKKHMLTWLDVMHDWPISRQIAWGIRIPVWYKITPDSKINVTFIDKNNERKNGLVNEFNFEEVEKGLQNLSAPKNSKYIISKEKPSESEGQPAGNYLQETDTFDTWFSSGQWPIVTLKDNEYDSLLPTDFMGTLSDILKFWVSRMILFSLYLKGKVPFKNVYLWSMVADSKGVKMSKSKGNVVNPVELVDKYGADALRFSVLYGIPAGSKVILSDDKVRGMRNFGNKLWNIGRFLEYIKDEKKEIKNEDKKYLTELNEITETVTNALEKYKFNEATETLYEYVWHKIADLYINDYKEGRCSFETLSKCYFTSLKLLHPFMPFVTETIWGELKELRENPEELLITSQWPPA